VRLLLIVVSLLVVAWKGVFMNSANANSTETFEFINALRAFPTSFDPMESDWSGNQDLARMIYLTPIELSADDKLTSTLLEKYVFNPKTKEIEFVVRQGLKFSDGTPITADDVAFAIARVAFTLDNFPIVSEIKGLSEWKIKKDALLSLPVGLVVDGHRVFLKLNKSPQHPLFRFLAPQFSVIPKSAVDLATNKLKTNQPPTSGHYVIKEMRDPEVHYELRQLVASRAGAKMPNRIVMRYVTPQDFERKALSKIDDRTVVMSSNLRYSPDLYVQMRNNSEFRYLQSTDIGILVLNPKSEIFRDPLCRRIFAETFRDHLHKSSLAQFGVEGSLFTKVLPGYVSENKLAQGSSISEKERELCMARFRSTPVTWFKRPWGSGETYHTVLEKSGSALGIKQTSIENHEGGALKAFAENKIDGMFLFTGFWATDTAGDLKMLFTPNLWYPGFLDNLTHDKAIAKMILNLEKETDSVKRKALFESLNAYIYNDATMSVFSHPKTFFMYAKKNQFIPPPVGMMEPAPWQLFQL
jgi:ABC-type transport system substrate-binding protein